MTRRSIACLFLVGAGLLAAPAVANATPTPPPADTCTDTNNNGTTDDEDCGGGSSAIDLAALFASLTTGANSGQK
ncbi:hypothetical protein [Rhodococcus oryzae]|uniref:hypothetical protein n=1 Tax=Rhodococcus oryzae TaxID=2571143 RepID=UPI0037A26674